MGEYENRMYGMTGSDYEQEEREDVKKEMRVRDVINRLNDLAGDRASFFRDDGDDEVFRDDYDALLNAVALLEEFEGIRDEIDRGGDDILCRTNQNESGLTSNRTDGESSRKNKKVKSRRCIKRDCIVCVRLQGSSGLINHISLSLSTRNEPKVLRTESKITGGNIPNPTRNELK
jgi:hypothetical protein